MSYSWRKRRRSYGRRRSGDGRVAVHRVRVGKPQWIDPFPGILGTKPEKMVLAELYRRNIPFAFQYELGPFDFIEENKQWRVDFCIPDMKVVIEVNGEYWHTQPGAMEADAFKYSVLEYAGYKVYVWWEMDILLRLLDLFMQAPELERPAVTGPPVKMENDIDDLRAVRRVNARRLTRHTGAILGRTRRQRRRSVRGYATSGRI